MMQVKFLVILILTVLCLVAVNHALDVSMEVNVHVGGGKKHVSIVHRPQPHASRNLNTKADETSTSTSQQQDVNDSGPVVSKEIASESRDVIKTAKSVISKADETVIAENYIEFASKIQEIYNQIPTNDKTKDLKKLLASYIQLFSKNSKHPTSDILTGSLNDIAMKSENSKATSPPGTVSFEESSSGGAKTMFNLGSIISSQIGRISQQIVGQVSSQIGQSLNNGQIGTALNNVTPEKIKEIMDRMGSYAGGMNLVGVQLGTNIADVLNRLGLPESSQLASLLGKTITSFSQSKLAPLEATVKSSVMPRVVKSSTPITESIGMLAGRISKSSAFKTVALPAKYQEMKNGLKETIGKLRNKKPIGAGINQTKPLRVGGNRVNRNPAMANRHRPQTATPHTKPLRVRNPNRPSTPSRPARNPATGSVNHVRPARASRPSGRISNPGPRPAAPAPARVVHRAAPAAVVHRAAAPARRR